MLDIQIRAAEPRDADDLTALFNCPGVIAGTLQLPWQSVEERRERLVQRSPDRHPLVAVTDARVVGMLGLQVEAVRVAVTAATSAWPSTMLTRGEV